MAARNYQPLLRFLMHRLNVYISRYQTLIANGSTPDQAVALTALIAALDAAIFEYGNPQGV